VYSSRSFPSQSFIYLEQLGPESACMHVMAQSGLRPKTVANLKIKDVEGVLDADTQVPAIVKVRQENTKGKFQGYFSFIGYEAAQALKDYLKTRTAELTPESYVFTKFGHEDKPVSAGVLSHIFGNIVLKLREKGVLNFETKTKKIEGSERSRVSISELRLYGLRKWFRKHAGFAGVDFVNFWMGHSLGVDEHYFTRDPEHHRKIYKEKAMPHLRLETSTPSETDRTIAKQTEVIEELKRELQEAQQRIQQLEKFSATVEFSEMKKQMKESLLELIKEGKLTFGEGVKVKIDRKEVKEN